MFGASDAGVGGDEHVLRIAERALFRVDVSTISAFDERLIREAHILDYYHEHFDGQFFSYLRKLSPNMPVQVALEFLFDAYAAGNSVKALEVLHVILHDDSEVLRRYDRADIQNILAEHLREGIPIHWLVASHSRFVEDEEEDQSLNPHDWSHNAEQNSSGLNIEAMRNFK